MGGPRLGGFIFTALEPDLATVPATARFQRFYLPRPRSADGPYRIGVTNYGLEMGWGSGVPDQNLRFWPPPSPPQSR